MEKDDNAEVKVEEEEKVVNKWKVMFQNDKTAIYEFIFIDHIVFISMEKKATGRLANGDSHVLFPVALR